MRRFRDYLDAICAAISGLSLVAIVFVNFVDAVGRQFGNPFLGQAEIVSFLLMIFFFSGLSIFVREDGHIRIGLAQNLYKGALKKAENWVTLAAELAGTILIAYMAFHFAQRQELLGTISMHFEWPTAPFLYAASVFAALSLVFLLHRIWTNLTQKEPVQESATPQSPTQEEAE